MKKLCLPLLSIALLLAACGGDSTPTTDAKNTTAPTVSLTAAQSGTSVNLSATTSDNVAVTKVEFYRGSTLVSTDTTSPYTASDTVSMATNGSVTYTAKGYDAAGNVGQNSKTITVNVSPPRTTAYQGQYYWVLFTNLEKPDTSIVGEGVAIFNDEFRGTEGQTLGSGAYSKARPEPTTQGDATIGQITLGGQKALTNAFFHDTSEDKTSLIAIDNDGVLSPDEKGQLLFIGEGATFDLNGKVVTEGYFGMLRTNPDPNAKSANLSSNQQAVAKAQLMAALDPSEISTSRLNMNKLKNAAVQLEHLPR